MATPADSEFDYIEAPPPEYSSIHILQQITATPPPPYDTCVRNSGSQSHKPRWSTSLRTVSCVRVAACVVSSSGLLMLLAGIILLALQQFLHARLALLGWCLFGSSCALLLLSAYLWRSIVSQNGVRCFGYCLPFDNDGSSASTTSTFSNTESGVSSPSAPDCINHNYANPPDARNGPPPYHANASARPNRYLQQNRNVATERNERLPRIPIVTFSSRVRPVSLHASPDARIAAQSQTSTTTTTTTGADEGRPSDRPSAAVRPVSAAQTSLATPLTVITSLGSQRPAPAAAAIARDRELRFAVNQGYVVDESLASSQPRANIGVVAVDNGYLV